VVKTQLSCFSRRENRVKGSFRDEACEEAVVPCGGFALETHGTGRAILADAAFSAARNHIHHRRQTGFHPERTRMSGPARNADGVN
jgi:hypothetical protein